MMMMIKSIVLLSILLATATAFAPVSFHQQKVPSSQQLYSNYEDNDNGVVLTRISEGDEGVPIPFLDVKGNSFIECYADSIATVEGVDYTIGVPCDYCVALCYFEGENFLPVELDDKLMDDIFPVAENIVGEEFGEELALQRTPQTLTLVGELDDDIDDEEEDEDDEDDEEEYNGEEEVEVLLTFEHRGTEFYLVRLLDPVLLVGKTDADRPDLRVLLTPEESDKVMPFLEDGFLKAHEDNLP
ncbi:unnamed protein product [Cylindrotheca closterium]|uniref:Uncharacterized protein n=1 Tax=Cylindrotheca closterium TaxID=2856 RepID=A0AAD2CD67_9STRA|nr:unnamed protein product [Cylindrotheca closterium]